jgi:hypothetical protein
MARNLKSNGPGHNSGGTPEKPFFDRLVALNKNMEALREDIKEVCIEAKESDVLVQPLKLAVRRYLETERERIARLSKEEECERILRALGEFVNTPLGGAAVEAAVQSATA